MISMNMSFFEVNGMSIALHACGILLRAGSGSDSSTYKS
jgi:hypothetical protein